MYLSPPSHDRLKYRSPVRRSIYSERNFFRDVSHTIRSGSPFSSTDAGATNPSKSNPAGIFLRDTVNATVERCSLRALVSDVSRPPEVIFHPDLPSLYLRHWPEVALATSWASVSILMSHDLAAAMAAPSSESIRSFPFINSIVFSFFVILMWYFCQW